MKHTGKKLWGILLSLVLLLSLVPAFSVTAFAAALDSNSTTWSEDSTIEDDVTISGVTVTADMTLTIPEGKTLTVTNGIAVNEGKTLTVEGKGTLVVSGSEGSFGGSGNGGPGGAAFSGAVTVKGGTVQATGGNGGDSGDETGGPGGAAFGGALTVNGGTVTATGGTGGNGYSYGGQGGAAFGGSVTVNGGEVTATGGTGGTGTMFTNGAAGVAFAQTVTLASGGTAQESDDGVTYTDLDISGTEITSSKRYVNIVGPASSAFGGSASYTIVIPATLTVKNAGWNASTGITASGTLADGKKISVTAESANGWKLTYTKDSQSYEVGYNLAAAEAAYSATATPASWEFSAGEVNAANGTTKTMGVIVDDYTENTDLPAGDYTDTVTFTASVVSASAEP